LFFIANAPNLCILFVLERTPNAAAGSRKWDMARMTLACAAGSAPSR
jgi:hypothetical protein